MAHQNRKYCRWRIGLIKRQLKPPPTFGLGMLVAMKWERLEKWCSHLIIMDLVESVNSGRNATCAIAYMRGMNVAFIYVTVYGEIYYMNGVPLTYWFGFITSRSYGRFTYYTCSLFFSCLSLIFSSYLASTGFFLLFFFFIFICCSFFVVFLLLRIVVVVVVVDVFQSSLDIYNSILSTLTLCFLSCLLLLTTY